MGCVGEVPLQDLGGGKWEVEVIFVGCWNKNLCGSELITREIAKRNMTIE